MFKNKKIMGIVIAALLVVCLTCGTIAVYAANPNSKGNGDIDEQEDAVLTAQKQEKKGEIPLNKDGTPAAPDGRGSRLEIEEKTSDATENEDAAAQNAKRNGNIEEQEDEALTAAKDSKKNEVPLNADGTPAAPGGRGSRMR